MKWIRKFVEQYRKHRTVRRPLKPPAAPDLFSREVAKVFKNY